MTFVEQTIPNNASSAIITDDNRGVIPQGLLIEPPDLYFGALVVDGDTLTRSFKVTNIGRKTLRIESVVLEAVAQFTLSGEFPDLLKPNKSFEMTVTYASNTPGLAAGIIRITTSEDRAPYFIGLSGRVIGSLYLEQVFDSFRALVDQEAYARATADEAEAGERLLLQATMSDEVDAKISVERTARVTQYEATATSIETLEVRIEENTASLSEERTTRVQADQALAQRIDTLEAVVPDTADHVARAAIEQEAIVRAQRDEAEAIQRNNLASTVSSNDVSVRALISNESVARANAIQAETTSRNQVIASVQTDYNGKISASVSESSSAIANINGKMAASWQLQVTAGRKISAVKAYADGTTSSLDFLANTIRFFIDDADTVPKPLVTIGQKDGVPSLVLNGDLFADGSVTAKALNIGVLGNLLTNSVFLNASGWGFTNNTGQAVQSIDGAGAAWVPTNMHALTTQQVGTVANSTVLFADVAGIIPGQTYEVSGYTGAHRANMFMNVEFRNSSGTLLSAAFKAGHVSTNNQDAVGGTNLSDFKRLYAFIVAPATATVARIIFSKYGTASGNTNSWMMLTAPYFGNAGANQTTPSPYAPIGLGVRITPDLISTPSLSAITANIGTITSGDINLIGGGSFRANGKSWANGGNGFVLAGDAASYYMDVQTGASRIWMSSWGDCGIQFPGILMTNGGLTISQVNVIDTFNVRGNAITVPVSAYIGGITRFFYDPRREFQILDAWIDAGGAPISIWCSAMCSGHYPGGGEEPVGFYLTRNGIRLMDSSYNGYLGTMQMTDYPGAGVHHYELYMPWGTYTDFMTYKRSMILLGCKR